MAILFPGTYPIAEAVEVGKIRGRSKDIENRKFMIRKRFTAGSRAGTTVLYAPKIHTAKPDKIREVIDNLNNKIPADSNYEVYAHEIER